MKLLLMIAGLCSVMWIRVFDCPYWYLFRLCKDGKLSKLWQKKRSHKKYVQNLAKPEFKPFFFVFLDSEWTVLYVALIYNFICVKKIIIKNN